MLHFHMVSKCIWNLFSALDRKKKVKEKKNHTNNKTKPRWLKMVMLKLNHKLSYNSKMLRFLLSIPTILELIETAMPTHWQGFPQIV